MSNTLLTISKITNEALMVLENELTFTGKVDRNYDDQFAVVGAKIGATVNVRRPGRFIGTTGLDRYPESAWSSLRKVERQIPLRRHGTAAEVSAAVVFLLSDMAAYITGVELRVDGGFHVGAQSFLFEPPPPRNQQIFDGFHREERARILDDD